MMVNVRVIPCLLLHKGGLYKTVQFKKPTYIGDPINAIKIFNEKEVDELIFLDIDASAGMKEPNYKVIEDIASECFMPLCYGGGVKTIEQMKKIYFLGVEKISLGSAAVENPHLITEASKLFGKQSVVVTIDFKKNFWGQQKVFIRNGKVGTGLDVLTFAQQAEAYGAGEIILNSIDRDGMMNGYDIEMITKIKQILNVPIVALGGSGSITDMQNVVKETGINAVAAGSMFVYQGPLKGVLINYPSYSKLQEVFDSQTTLQKDRNIT
ncbi:AglZ/HisF2 family acetamidino modification protein [Sulfuricurvum sp.]|uniref:AglZ/HisF2 family acetamidino modification protein n=1 Tax=Sulfuricurvum sp. TaxID=2025608 RepID=UPI003BB1992B